MLALSIITTRTSVADRSRGLDACQLSKTVFRMRSPRARLSRTASSVAPSHVSTTRRAGRLDLETDFEPVIGAYHFQRRSIAGQLLVPDAFLVHPLDVLVLISRL